MMEKCIRCGKHFKPFGSTTEYCRDCQFEMGREVIEKTLRGAERDKVLKEKGVI